MELRANQQYLFVLDFNLMHDNFTFTPLHPIAVPTDGTKNARNTKSREKTQQKGGFR